VGSGWFWSVLVACAGFCWVLVSSGFLYGSGTFWRDLVDLVDLVDSAGFWFLVGFGGLWLIL
jgi:hypothetical protein